MSSPTPALVRQWSTHWDCGQLTGTVVTGDVVIDQIQLVNVVVSTGGKQGCAVSGALQCRPTPRQAELERGTFVEHVKCTRFLVERT